MEMIKIFGDLHLRNDKKPFDKVSKLVVDYIIKECEELSINDYAIFEGDITDKSITAGEVQQLLYRLFNNLNCNIIIIHGNHTIYWNAELQSYSSSIAMLKELNNIEIITEPIKKEIFGLKMLFLPYMKMKMLGGKSLKFYYENLPEEFSSPAYDYILGHIADETNTTFGHYCDLSYLKGKKVLGHIHKYNGNSLGSMSICNYGERQKTSYYMKLEIENKSIKKSLIKVPKFIDYYTLNYNQNIKEITVDATCPIFDIINAPSEEIIKSDPIYKDLNIRNIVTKELKVYYDEDQENDLSLLSVDVLWDKFIAQNKDLSEEQIQYLQGSWNLRN